MGDYKLIIVNKMATHCDALMWSPLHYPYVRTDLKEKTVTLAVSYNHSIVEDPNERNELSNKEPVLL